MTNAASKADATNTKKVLVMAGLCGRLKGFSAPGLQAWSRSTQGRTADVCHDETYLNILRYIEI